MDLTQASVLCGTLITLIIVAVTIVRQRRFEARDFYSFIVGFIIGSNIPPSIFLCLYAFFPDPKDVPTKLHGYEKYIFLAGLSLLIISLMTIWKLIREAHAKPPTH